MTDHLHQQLPAERRALKQCDHALCGAISFLPKLHHTGRCPTVPLSGHGLRTRWTNVCRAEVAVCGVASFPWHGTPQQASN